MESSTSIPLPMRASSSSSLFGVVVQCLSQLAICAYLIWLAVNEHEVGSAAEKVDQVILIDFLGFFLLSFVLSAESRSVHWTWPISFDMGLRVIGYIALIIIFIWFMEGAAGWTIAIAWGFGILTNLSNVQSLRKEAIARVIWAIISAFLAALVGSILGVKEDDLLTEHLPTLLGWGLLYFGSVAIGSLAFGFAAYLEKESGDTSNR